MLGALLLHDDRLELCRVAGLQVGGEVSTGNLKRFIVEITNLTKLSQLLNVANRFGSLDVNSVVTDDRTAVNILDGIFPVFKSL